jgi:predicted 3-demethylubiquinone-9 3-methyltransferase (glyoxalase superfamily)
MPRIVPNLWFDTNAEEAAEFYVSVFPSSRINDVIRYTEAGPGEPGTVLTIDFELDGQPFTGINGGPMFTFDEAVSFLIEVEDQTELDYYWDTLSAGGKEGECGWLTDRFGLSWQVVPKGWSKLIEDPERADRTMRALYGMKKLDIAALEAAAAGSG